MEDSMRGKSMLLMITLAMLTLAAGCHRKGGGYLAPKPVSAISR
jgi:predicted small lipoprotein YifL